MSEITYRWINGYSATTEEWDRIEAILCARNWMSLNRDTSRILVAEEGSELRGFICLQLVPHTEPLFVVPSMRGTGVAEELANRMLEFMTEIKARGFMVIADNQVAAKLCAERGMKKVDAPVFVMGGGS